jgi:phosphohistidine phosphatase
MHLFLIHHGVAVGPEEDARRPLSAVGLAGAARVAAKAAALGAKPEVVWHSGKLRAKQTAQEFWRACNALAEFAVSRDLQPDDPPQWMRDRLRGETRSIAIAGHFPYLPRLLSLLLSGNDTGADFPLNGIVALVTDDEGETWQELWRIEN